MLTIERGLEIVMSVATAKDRPDWMAAESVPLSESPCRILREDVFCDSDSPPFDKSIRDGFAVRFEDLTADSRYPLRHRRVARGTAGRRDACTGQCCEIMTGAPLPAGANAVVMVEHTERPSPDVGAHSQDRFAKAKDCCGGRRGARRASAFCKPAAGLDLRISDCWQASGKARVHGFAEAARRDSRHRRRTGRGSSRLPDPARSATATATRFTRRSVAAGAEPVLLGIGRDNLDDLRRQDRPGLEHDILLVSGGVSMGKYDFVENVFAEFGVEVLFDKVAMKPGKPTVFGHRERNVCFRFAGQSGFDDRLVSHVCAAPDPASAEGGGHRAAEFSRPRLEAPAKCDPERAAIVPALVRFDGGAYRIQTAPWKGSSDLVGLARANALIVIPRREGTLQPGEMAQFLSLE